MQPWSETKRLEQTLRQGGKAGNAANAARPLGKAEKLKAVIDDHGDAPRLQTHHDPSLRWSTWVTRTPDVPPQVGVHSRREMMG